MVHSSSNRHYATTMNEHRQRFLDWIRRQLIGPAHVGRLQGSPLERYPAGVLYPANPGVSGVDPAGDDDDVEDLPIGGDDPLPDRAAKPVSRRRYVPPSSVGFSFFVHARGDLLLGITASGVTYTRCGERDEQGRFTRHEYKRDRFEYGFAWDESDADPSHRVILPPDGLLVDVRTRPHGAGQIVTVVLANRQDPSESDNDRAEHCLFEARLECEIRAGDLKRYPRMDPSLMTEEEQEIELRYRHKPIYAVGHGAAVDWFMEQGQRPRIWSEFMPAVDVPQVTVEPAGVDAGVLALNFLAEPKNQQEIPDRLTVFVDAYQRWVEGQREQAAQFDNEQERTTATRIFQRMEVAIDRMRDGIELLRHDTVAAEAFRIANQAMLDQMRRHRHRPGEAVSGRAPSWRPFQLAFLLTTIESTIREESDFRDLLDLIWFPTGGGKTEAYLGLIAFLIAWRRRQHPLTGSGTAAIMRYTLRLLTRQQFERAASMICAMELLRHGNPEQLGEEPITVGMWVGSAVSPNRFCDAESCVQEMAAGDENAAHKLVLRACPWCDIPLTAPDSYRTSSSEFHFLCSNPACEFGPNGDGTDQIPLPCNVIDEALYQRPPTLLIATIDKFARLAWEERASVFFNGAESGSVCSRPPELIIQDELHLVAGPLGSVAGLYETALETVLALRGIRPKYIASTATIRMAAEQVRSLYGREAAVFPPAGVSATDSWFARDDESKPGRLYVGYLAAALDQQHCLAPLAATLLAAPFAAFSEQQDRDDLLEAWWTAVIYHGSLRGVSNSHNAYVTDVRDFARRLDREREERAREDAAQEEGSGETPPTDGARHSRRNATSHNAAARAENRQNLAQVTSRATAHENARTFYRLAHNRGKPDCLDAVLATNMISVGIDVDRLALMVINGQPFSTAEYIQASSRIGRAAVPGIVVANYYRHQARSLSHYENFRPYHESFYRFVEPTSVTPFTRQVRNRALHAALIIALRHGCDELRANQSAGKFDSSATSVRETVEALKQRCRRAADQNLADATADQLDRLVEQWHEEAKRCREKKRRLLYETTDNGANALLCQFNVPDAGIWRTLNSMRNVEETGLLEHDD